MKKNKNPKISDCKTCVELDWDSLINKNSIEHSKKNIVKNNYVFERMWKNSKNILPTEGNRYWCLIEEVNDLGKSYFQWNCYFDENRKIWSDGGKQYDVIYWTELAPRPF